MRAIEQCLMLEPLISDGRVCQKKTAFRLDGLALRNLQSMCSAGRRTPVHINEPAEWPGKCWGETDH